MPRRPWPRRGRGPEHLPLTGAADARWSVISSAHDTAGPDDELLDLALGAVTAARTLVLADLESRGPSADATWVRTWPGEHYRLLAGLARVMEPAGIIEVGTFKGQGALALHAGAPKARVVTYDVMPWADIDGTVLSEGDLDRIEPRVGDLGDSSYRAGQLDTLRAADLVFIDGPKDGRWEQAAVPAILADLTDRRRLVVLDDIRLVEMVQVWRDLPNLKLDLTSFGHWSGTGLLWTA